MTVDDKNILWLDLFDFLTYPKKNKLLNLVGRGNCLRKNFLTTPQIKDIVSKEEFDKMALCLHNEFLEIRLKKYEEKGVHCITFYNENYPYLLKEISSPPFCLYCKGNLQLLNTTCVGIVGSRKPTEYGIVVTKQYAKELSNAGVTVVSGMAAGVDGIAHKEVLQSNGQTIAVLAGGFDNIYPLTNLQLFNEMIKNNLVITEYRPDVKPETYYFPVRNRIIAGLSKGVIVTEAGEKSGSLHTINYAIEFNREIFAVPGKINSPMSKGTNSIIQQYQGSITLSPEDVLTFLNIKKEKNNKNLEVQLDINAQLVLDYIVTEKKTFQEIADFTKLSAKELNSILLELEMSGLVTKLANNSYIMS